MSNSQRYVREANGALWQASIVPLCFLGEIGPSAVSSRPSFVSIRFPKPEFSSGRRSSPSSRRGEDSFAQLGLQRERDRSRLRSDGVLRNGCQSHSHARAGFQHAENGVELKLSSNTKALFLRYAIERKKEMSLGRDRLVGRKEKPRRKVMIARTILERNRIVKIVKDIATGQPRCPPAVAARSDNAVFAQGESGEIVARVKRLRSDEHVRLIAQMSFDELFVVAGDEKATVDVLPAIVIHPQVKIAEIRVQFEEGQEIATSNVNADPSDRNQRR